MTSQQFEILLDERIGKIRATLASKAGEYATDADRLHSFKVAAGLMKQTSAESLMGMLVKHWVSIDGLVKTRAVGYQPAKSVIDEKIGDAINYLILLEALFAEGE